MASLANILALQGAQPVPGIASAKSPLAAAKPRPDAKTAATAKDFEKMFLEQVLDRVFASEGEGPMGGDGAGAAIYRGMLVKEYAGAIVDRGGLGIAPQIQRELLRLQEAAHAR